MKNIIIVGFGFMGTMHAQVYRQLAQQARLVGVVDKDPVRVKKTMKDLKFDLPVYPTIKAALAKEEVDVVDICLPTDLHVRFALEAIAARKHVFCEKPFALNVKDARKVTAAAKKAGVFMQLGQCIRFWPEYQAFTQFVKSGKAGKLLSLSLQRRAAHPIGTEKWFLDAKRCGGGVLDLHIHDTDYVLHLLGTPKAVTSVGNKDKTGWSHIYTTYHYPKIAVTAEGGWDYPEKWGFQMAFQAVFEKGTVEFDCNQKPSMTVTMNGADRKPLEFDAPAAGESSTKTGNVSSLGGYFNELQYFLKCLDAKKAPAIATPIQATESLRVVLAEIQSASAKGRTVKI